MGVGDLLSFREYFHIIRQLSFHELEQEARTPPAVLTLAQSASLARQVAEALFGPDSVGSADARAFDETVDPFHYDVIVTVERLPSQLSRNWTQLFKHAKEELRLVEVHPRVVGDEQAELAARARIVERIAEERVPAFGRHLEVMRDLCAKRVVWDTSVADAQFALVSNIPDVVPLIGNIISAGADFLVLTKNQLLMLYKLAAIFGRDLDNRRRIYSEMLPVVGAGLFWRTVARELTSLMPFGLGTVPKVTIAFAGTWAVGQAAVVYFEQGKHVNRAQMRSLYSDALDLLRQSPLGRRLGG